MRVMPHAPPSFSQLTERAKPRSHLDLVGPAEFCHWGRICTEVQEETCRVPGRKVWPQNGTPGSEEEGKRFCNPIPRKLNSPGMKSRYSISD